MNKNSTEVIDLRLLAISKVLSESDTSYEEATAIFFQEYLIFLAALGDVLGNEGLWKWREENDHIFNKKANRLALKIYEAEEKIIEERGEE